MPYFFLLCETRARRYEPTVANSSLVQIIAADSLNDQFRVLHDILQNHGKEHSLLELAKISRSERDSLADSRAVQTILLLMTPPSQALTSCCMLPFYTVYSL